MYFVYILECADKSLYTGITTNLERRLAEHKEGTGAKYTRGRGAKRIVYSERTRNRSSASRREAQIKTLSRAGKQALAASCPIIPTPRGARREPMGVVL